MLVNTPYGLPNEPTTTIAQSACYNNLLQSTHSNGSVNALLS